ncbi:g6134 [Coccomyxa elongata]
MLQLGAPIKGALAQAISQDLVQEETPIKQPLARQRVSWGIPHYVPLPMQPSTTATENTKSGASLKQRLALVKPPPAISKPSVALEFVNRGRAPPGAGIDHNGNHGVTSQRQATPTLSPGPHSQQLRPPLETLPHQQGILHAIQEEAEERSAAPGGTPHAVTDTDGQQLRRSRPKAAKKLNYNMPDDEPGAVLKEQLMDAERPQNADDAEADDEQEERGRSSSPKKRTKRREAKGNAEHMRAHQSKHAAKEISKQKERALLRATRTGKDIKAYNFDAGSPVKAGNQDDPDWLAAPASKKARNKAEDQVMPRPIPSSPAPQLQLPMSEWIPHEREDSDMSDSDKSDGFTQALQKLQNAAPAAPKQPANPVPVPEDEPDLPNEPVTAAADQHPPSPVSKKPETGTGEGAFAQAGLQGDYEGHAHGGRDLQSGSGARAAAQKSTRTARGAGGKDDAVVEATEDEEKAQPAKGKAAANASNAKAAPVKKPDRKQTNTRQKQLNQHHPQNVTHVRDVDADANKTAEMPVQQPKRKRHRQPTAQTKQADDAGMESSGPSFKKGRLAKQLSTDSPDNDIEIDFAANEGAPAAHDSLPAILGHMPQLAKEPEEAGTDADTDREPDLADDQDNLLSPIPDLPILQANTTPSKVQTTAKPAAAPRLAAPTTDKRVEKKQAAKSTRAPATKGRKHKAAAHAMHDEEASDDGEGGPSLNAVVQQLAAVNNDGDSDEEEGMAEVQLLLKRVMAHKKAITRKKEMQIIQSAQAEVDAIVQAHQTSVLKEEKAIEAAMTKSAAQHTAALERHQQRLRDIHAAFEAAVTAEWAEVQKTGKRQAASLKEAQLAQRKRAAADKRALAEVEQRTAAMLAATEAKVKSLRKKAGKMSGLARVLQPFARAEVSASDL